MATSEVRSEPPLIVIVGPTASGKTGLAVTLAREFDGEVISADSRAIYRGLSIGTAKPTVEEQAGVPHWGIDLVDPGVRFTAADFQSYVKHKIADIRRRGKVPFLVGGTGLYIDAVVYDFRFSESSNDVQRRAELTRLPMESLYDYCTINNIELPKNSKNKRHVVNTILRKGAKLERKHKLNNSIIVVGIATEKEELNKRIAARAEMIFDKEVISEAINAAEQYGWDNEAMTGNIYPLIRRYINKEISQSELVERFVTADRQLAKRQLTWFRRNDDIVWLPLDQARKYIAQELSRLSKS